MRQQDKLRDLADQDMLYITLFPARCNTSLMQSMDMHEALAASSTTICCRFRDLFGSWPGTVACILQTLQVLKYQVHISPWSVWSCHDQAQNLLLSVSMAPEWHTCHLTCSAALSSPGGTYKGQKQSGSAFKLVPDD